MWFLYPHATVICLSRYIAKKKFSSVFFSKNNEIAQKLVRGKCNDDCEQIRGYDIKFMEWFFVFATDCFYQGLKKKKNIIFMLSVPYELDLPFTKVNIKSWMLSDEFLKRSLRMNFKLNEHQQWILW